MIKLTPSEILIPIVRGVQVGIVLIALVTVVGGGASGDIPRLIALLLSDLVC